MHARRQLPQHVRKSVTCRGKFGILYILPCDFTTTEPRWLNKLLPSPNDSGRHLYFQPYLNLRTAVESLSSPYRAAAAMPAQMPHIMAPNKHISVEALEPHTFAAFGTVIQNPAHAPAGSAYVHHNAVSANQGSALKYIDVSHLTNHYDMAPSRKPAKAVMNMFVCSPRELQSAPSMHETSSGGLATANGTSSVFPVQILERHPFTPQTFIPTGLALNDATTSYLVVVAPTLPVPSGKTTNRPPPYPLLGPKRRRSITDIFSRARPSLFTNTNDPPSGSSNVSATQQPKGSGEPDLTQVKAFIANGTQSVTYGPGTWHAPMVVLGAKSIDFVVVQYANGVALEDCQEIAVEQETGAEGLNVVIENSIIAQKHKEKSKL